MIHSKHLSVFDLFYFISVTSRPQPLNQLLHEVLWKLILKYQCALIEFEISLNSFIFIKQNLIHVKFL